MRPLLFKLILFLCVWYEVSVELGLNGSTAMVVALLVCGGGMMLLRLPFQILSMLGPRAAVLVAPLAVWIGLMWWLMPGTFTAFPALALVAAAGLALIGAAAHYAISRYPLWFARIEPMLRASISPVASILLGIVAQLQSGLLSLLVTVIVIAMPLRLGWRFIGPVSPHKFDARMGDAEGFRRAGFSDDA